jgi:7-cyano-7-deazaguanine synthase in queuosine biosynthesis
MREHPLHVVLCNGAAPPNRRDGSDPTFTLDYGSTPGRTRNIKLNLPDFVRSVRHLPDRVLDLIEIAAYVHAGDRLVYRGIPNAVELHGWHRRFLFRIRVRDYDFWKRNAVKEALSEVVVFMTGDESYDFEFEAGHKTALTSLFDDEIFELHADLAATVALFSGGLDSLTGTLDKLHQTSGEVYLVSHAAQPSVKRTQNRLVEALGQQFPRRVRHYKFNSHLVGQSAREESQRSRSLLFCTIAYAIMHGMGLRSFYLFENGITSINFPKRQSLMNARASRTTHPQTVYLLQRFLSLVEEHEVVIHNPFLYQTKTDVVSHLKELGHEILYKSSVSCGVTRSKSAPATHCGGCNQCIDRRFAVYAAGMGEYDDETLYEQDFIKKAVEDANKKKSLLDFLRQASSFVHESPEQFAVTYINELTDLWGYLPDVERWNEDETVEKVHGLCKRHGNQVWEAYKQMQLRHHDPSRPVPPGSVFAMVGRGQHFIEPFEAAPLVQRLEALKPGISQAKEYEALMEEVIPALFGPDLVEPHRQVANASRKGITDLTLRIAADTGFWKLVQGQYGNIAVSFELKNKEKLNNNDFNQIARRLNHRKGNFGILIARRVRAFDEEAIREWLNDGKVIVALDDKDISTMLYDKERGASPTEYIWEKLRRMLDRIG